VSSLTPEQEGYEDQEVIMRDCSANGAITNGVNTLIREGANKI
jgi:hypothetical protein